MTKKNYYSANPVESNTITVKPGIRQTARHQPVYLGIDIGGTNTKLGWVDNTGQCMQYDSFPTRADRPFSEFFKDLKTRLSKSLETYTGTYELVGIGIGAPIANRWTGTMEAASNFSWGKVPVVAMIRENFDVPVVIDNDANAAAMGEKCFGSARTMKNFIMVTLGTGLGSGFVVNGSLLYGAHGFAGELGHIIVDWNGRQCGCGRKGCLETYVSASGIKRTVFELFAEKMERSSLRSIDFETLQAEQITVAAQRGDPIALEAFERTGKILGQKLADAVAFTDPEAIILGGGLSRSGKFLLTPAQHYFEQNLLNVYKGNVHLILSSLSTKDFAVLGAGALIMQEVQMRVT